MADAAAPVPREKLLSFIKKQKLVIKKNDEAKAELSQIIVDAIGGEAGEQWSFVIDGVKALAARPTAGPSGGTDEKVALMEGELKSRGDRMREMAIELDARQRRIEELEAAVTATTSSGADGIAEGGGDAEMVKQLQGMVESASQRMEAAWNDAEALRAANAEALDHFRGIPALEED